MDENLLEDITIYHKIQNGWDRYPVKASVRDTSIRNRTNTGKTDNDNALIRIFDVDGYGSSYLIAKDDVIVRGNVNNEIVSAPLTELRSVYGKENVYLVRSVDKYIFDDVITKELQHIKIGAI